MQYNWPANSRSWSNHIKKYQTNCWDVSTMKVQRTFPVFWNKFRTGGTIYYLLCFPRYICNNYLQCVLNSTMAFKKSLAKRECFLFSYHRLLLFLSYHSFLSFVYTWSTASLCLGAVLKFQRANLNSPLPFLRTVLCDWFYRSASLWKRCFPFLISLHYTCRLIKPSYTHC